MPSLAASRPFQRVMTTPAARLTEISRLLTFVSGFRCAEHRHRASVQQIVDGRVTYVACCQDMLDLVERELESLERRMKSLRI
jgi:hypothetical protein